MATVMLGLSRDEEQLAVADYFERFAWEGVPMDPDAMSAEQFLDAL